METEKKQQNFATIMGIAQGSTLAFLTLPSRYTDISEIRRKHIQSNLGSIADTSSVSDQQCDHNETIVGAEKRKNYGQTAKFRDERPHNAQKNGRITFFIKKSQPGLRNDMYRINPLT